MYRDLIEDQLLAQSWERITGGKAWEMKQGRTYLARATGFEGRTVNKFVAAGKFPGTIEGRVILLSPGEFLRWWRDGVVMPQRSMRPEDVIRRR